MSKDLEFKFDFEEVFEGIKKGVIKEMSEMTFDTITFRAINEVKDEMKKQIALTYKDEYEIRDEIKKEVKEKVFQQAIADLKNDFKQTYENTFGRDVNKSLDEAEIEIKKQIKSTTIDRLYNSLYSDIERQMKSRINDSISKIVNAVTGTNVKIKETGEVISQSEYDELVKRNERLTALEFGGVDNWEWYSDSINDYFKEYGKEEE